MMFAPGPLPDPAAAPAAVREFMAAAEAYQIEQRRSVLAWAALWCSCPPRREHVTAETGPAVLACLVHGQHIIHPATGEVI